MRLCDSNFVCWSIYHCILHPVSTFSMQYKVVHLYSKELRQLKNISKWDFEMVYIVFWYHRVSGTRLVHPSPYTQLNCTIPVKQETTWFFRPCSTYWTELLRGSQYNTTFKIWGQYVLVVFFFLLFIHQRILKNIILVSTKIWAAQLF